MSRSIRRALTVLAIAISFGGYSCSDTPTEPGGNGGGNTQTELLLAGHPDSNAAAATTLLLPMALPESEIVDHFLTNRVTALIRFDATVGDVNDALKRFDARIVSMNPGDNWLTLRAPATTVAEAKTVADSLVATDAFALAFPSFEVAAREIPPIQATERDKIRHLTRMKWPSAWNAAQAAKTKVTVIVPDKYNQLTQHDEIRAQRFPNSVLGGVTNRVNPITNTNEGNHGFMTSGILGANWDSEPLTGTSRNPAALLDIVSVPIGGLSFDDAIDEMVRHMPGIFDRFVMSTSFGYPDSMPSADIETHKLTRALLAMYWRRHVAPYRENSFVATAAGNRGELSGANGSSEFDNWQNPDFMRGDLRELVDPTMLSDEQRTALSDQHAAYLQEEPGMDARAVNGLVVGSSDSDGHESGFSSLGASVRALGEGVWAPCGIADANCIDPSTGGTVNGSSFATPQIAGLAAFLWSIDDTLTPDRIRTIIEDAYSETAGFVDAYRAVLSLDNAPSPADASVRLAILDVAGDDINEPPNGKFNEVDLQRFVIEFTSRAGMEQDYSRYDLNGDGFTGGAGRAAFDLSIDTPKPNIDLQPVVQVIEGVSKDFIEIALTDGEICLYYAYSSLWDPNGDASERKNITCANLLALVSSDDPLLTTQGAAFQRCREKLIQITTDPGGDVTPMWSPDGSQIVFMSNRTGGNTNIWAIRAAGGVATQITTIPQNSHPDWSPDGSQIVFMSNRSGTGNIWTISATGGTAMQLTTETLDSHPAWSPDGSQIAFLSRRSGNGDIWVMPAVGGEATQLTTGSQQDRHPAWSPDGSQIAYGSHRGGVTHLWVVPATGGTATQLTTDPLGGDEPTWSPDGSQIAFMSTRSGNLDIWMIPSTGGPATQITTSPQQDRQPSWSPDGSQIAFTSLRSGNNDTWVITLP